MFWLFNIIYYKNYKGHKPKCSKILVVHENRLRKKPTIPTNIIKNEIIVPIWPNFFILTFILCIFSTSMLSLCFSLYTLLVKIDDHIKKDSTGNRLKGKHSKLHRFPQSLLNYSAILSWMVWLQLIWLLYSIIENVLN
jgi:hypothetical protein